jgi:putative transposase
VEQVWAIFAAEIRRRRVERMRSSRHWRWHLDEMFVKISGEVHYLWRAVDHEGEVLEAYVTRRCDRKAALKFLKKAIRRHGSPEVIVTDRLRSYGAALRTMGAADLQEMGRYPALNLSREPGSGLCDASARSPGSAAPASRPRSSGI